jgi:LPPG:FO 2-phospho-L-lactate transferase
VLEAIRQAEAIVICPSNPWVSVDPVLGIPGIRSSLVEYRQTGCHLAAVSPIIGGKTIKGPAAKMFAELGIPPSALAVAAHYEGLVSDFFLDAVDSVQAGPIAELGIRPWVTDTVMNRVEDRRRLAQEVLGRLRVEKGEMLA